MRGYWAHVNKPSGHRYWQSARSFDPARSFDMDLDDCKWQRLKQSKTICR